MHMDLEEFIEAIKEAAEDMDDPESFDSEAEYRARLIQKADQDGAAQTLWNWGYEKFAERHDVDDLRDERNALAQEKEELQGKIDDLQSKIDELQEGQGDGDGTDVAKLKSQKQELEDKVEELQNEKEQTQEQFRSTVERLERRRVLDKVRRQTSGKLKDVYLDHVLPTLEDRIQVNGEDPTDPDVEIMQPDSELPMTGDDPIDRLAEEVVNNADPDFVVSNAEGGSGTEGGGSGAGGGEGNLAEQMRKEGEKTFHNESKEQAAQKRAKMGLGEDGQAE